MQSALQGIYASGICGYYISMERFGLEKEIRKWPRITLYEKCTSCPYQVHQIRAQCSMGQIEAVRRGTAAMKNEFHIRMRSST